MPTKDRNLPSVAIVKEGELMLFDCGEGTQRQAMRYGVNISRLSTIFLTHLHGDHIIGIAGLIRTLALNKRTKPLRIFVPQGEEAAILALIKFDKAIMTYPIEIKGVKTGEVYSGKDFKVTAFRLLHTVPTYGYVFDEPPKTRFKDDKCKALGIKGPVFSELLQKGRITIKGKRIKLEDVSYKIPGKKVVYASDTRPSKVTVAAAKDADLLIHESSYGKELASLAKARKHSTVEEAATVAKDAKVKQLILFHISARYRNTNTILNDATKIFKNTKIAADGDRIKF
jgi:ribonuclease Z